MNHGYRQVYPEGRLRSIQSHDVREKRTCAKARIPEKERRPALDRSHPRRRQSRTPNHLQRNGGRISQGLRTNRQAIHVLQRHTQSAPCTPGMGKQTHQFHHRRRRTTPDQSACQRVHLFRSHHQSDLAGLHPRHRCRDHRPQSLREDPQAKCWRSNFPTSKEIC